MCEHQEFVLPAGARGALHSPKELRHNLPSRRLSREACRRPALAAAHLHYKGLIAERRFYHIGQQGNAAIDARLDDFHAAGQGPEHAYLLLGGMEVTNAGFALGRLVQILEYP